tara:strand:+ start:771 stop:929 length:159 start_codon:yes stop_codon:yes gene_type:complete
MTKYDYTDHIAILTEINTLQSIAIETHCKIKIAKAKEKKMTEQRKSEESVPF